jgi:drug/metabolite transporter (DMT)-like permease
VTAALLILTSAIAHAAWNVLVKRQRASGPVFFAVVAVAAAVLTGPIAVPILLASDPAPTWVLWAVGSAVLHTSYMLALQRGYRVADVGVVYPLARGTGPLLAVLGAVVLLGERPSGTTLGGAALVVLGVLVVGTMVGPLAGSGPDLAAQRRRGVRYGFAVGALIAAYTLWDAVAVTMVGLTPIGHFWASLVGQAFALSVLALRNPVSRGIVRKEISRHLSVAVTVAVLSTASYVAILTAYGFAPVSVVAPAREVSVVLVALAGWLIFREPHPVRRLAGAAIVLLGIALLAV